MTRDVLGSVDGVCSSVWTEKQEPWMWRPSVLVAKRMGAACVARLVDWYHVQHY